MSEKYKYSEEMFAKKEWRKLKAGLDRAADQFPLFEKRENVFFEIQDINGLYSFKRFTYATTNGDVEESDIPLAIKTKVCVQKNKWEKCLSWLSNSEILFIYDVVAEFKE